MVFRLLSIRAAAAITMTTIVPPIARYVFVVVWLVGGSTACVGVGATVGGTVIGGVGCVGVDVGTGATVVVAACTTNEVLASLPK